MLGEVFDRFIEKSPISVMVRGTLERVFGLIPSIGGMSAPPKSSIRESCYFQRSTT